MSITLAVIKQYTNKMAYERGYEIYRKNKVYGYKDRVNEDLGLEYIDAMVEGRHQEEYFVSGIYRNSDDVIYDYTCTCPAYEMHDGLCKHCVALFLEYYVKQQGTVLEQQGTVVELERVSGTKLQQVVAHQRKSTPFVKQLLSQYAMKDKIAYLQPMVTGRIDLEPTLVRTYQKLHLEFKIGAEHKYVLKNMDQFIEAIEENLDVSYGKQLQFIHDYSAFTSRSQKLVNYIHQIVNEEYTKAKQSVALRHGREYTHGKEVRLVPRTLEQFFHLMRDNRFSYNMGYGKLLTVTVVEGNPDIFVRITKVSEGGIRVWIPIGDLMWGEKHLYIRKEELIYECSKKFTRDLRELFLLGEKEQELYLDLFGEDIRVFCATILPLLTTHCIVDMDEVNLEQYAPVQGVYKVYLDMNEKKEIFCKVQVKYKDKVYDILDGFTHDRIYRDIKKESALLQIIRDYFDETMTHEQRFILHDAHDTLFALLHEGIERMNQVAEVYVDDKIKRLKIHKTAKFHIGVSLKQRLLELTLVTNELPLNEINQFLDSYRKRKKYHRMKNGDFMQITDNSIAALTDLVEGLNLSSKDLKKGVIVLPKYRALYVDQVLNENGTVIDSHRNQEFKALIRDMKEVGDSDYQVPSSLVHVLRDYQKTGYRWLRTLDYLGFGGILADDMGLGKTLQVIALLVSGVEEKRVDKPSIIICPASLVYNWEGEINRFAPMLHVAIIAGNALERKRYIETMAEYDVLITSYDLLKRDSQLYEEKEFYYEILDEAQAIKNHATLGAQAVKAIVATTRFALTGTPIENRLQELWSLFDYLMPGMLYSYKQFRQELEMPIVLKKDEMSTKRMRQMIKPFILRRLKKDVLKELPEKEINVVYTKLHDEQLAVYSANVQKLKKRLQAQSREEFNTSKIQTLAELTKLRQICCDPILVYENYRGGSAKIETCLELIRNAKESGHKVLVFSQFTSMLSILEEQLMKENIGYYKLTGATKKEDRMRMVNCYQQDETPVFMISLKAGGTGLNLTAASIVIHFDPWWNLAAENQATDRTHRIGQTNKVTVYKIIAKDTIEENILNLQDRKKGLADQIISTDGISISALTQEDFMSLL